MYIMFNRILFLSNLANKRSKVNNFWIKKKDLNTSLGDYAKGLFQNT